MPHALHSEESALSRRHRGSWLLLALAAGCVNAGTFLAFERFVTHVTSTVTRVGLKVWGVALMAEYLAVLGAFVVGSMLSVLPIQARVHRGKSPRHATPLVMVALVLVAIALLGRAGALGTFGERTGHLEELATVCTLALAMGLMNGTVTTSATLPVRATHMSGQATDFGIHLAEAWFTEGDERRRQLGLARLRGGKLVAFSAGGLVMLPMTYRWGHLAFLLPAVIVLLATVRSFLPSRVGAPRGA